MQRKVLSLEFHLAGVRMIADLPGADLRGADLSQANPGVDIKNQGMGQTRTDLSRAKLTGANLRDANLNRVVMMFADLSGANLTGANLFRAQNRASDPQVRQYAALLELELG